MFRSRTRLLAAASVFVLSAGAAGAQESTAVQEIVVTAQKQQQQAIDVPIALTAFGARRLEDLGVQDFADLSLFTPGFEVQAQSPNNAGFVMRGITSDSTEAYAEARVSVFQDGVSISKAQAAYVELFDLERVEVAKGPQSTLFGRGALIGGVNLIQAKASTDGFEGYAKVEAGSHNAWLGEAAVNLPITERVALRMAGRLRSRDGYVDNALGGDAFQSIDSGAFRVSLRLEPTEQATVDLIANYQKDTPTSTAFKSNGFSPTDPATGRVLADRSPHSAATLAAGPGFQGGREMGLIREVRSLTGLATVELTDVLTLSSISAYRDYDSEELFDPDGLSLADPDQPERRLWEAVEPGAAAELRRRRPDAGLRGRELLQVEGLPGPTPAVRRADDPRGGGRPTPRGRGGLGPAGHHAGPRGDLRLHGLHRRPVARGGGEPER